MKVNYNDRNWNHCKEIAESFEAYALGHMRECPHCQVHFDDRVVDHDDARCPECGKSVQFEYWTIDDYPEMVTLDEYLIDNVYHVEVTRDGFDKNAPILGARLCIEHGRESNVYIVTRKRVVELCGWRDSAQHPVSKAACEALLAEIEEQS